MGIFIKKKLQKDATNDLEDIIKIKKALSTTGHYEIPQYGLTPYPDNALFTAIKDFQKESGLKVDGVIHPDGETLEHLNKKLKDDPGVRTPIMRCIVCGTPHGGSHGDMCSDCDKKS